jgi:hypothetical protein
VAEEVEVEQLARHFLVVAAEVVLLEEVKKYQRRPALAVVEVGLR